MDSEIIKQLFGLIIIFIGIEMLFREFYAKKMKQSKLLLIFIGLLSGILCGLYGIGALLSAYISRVTDDMSSFKANICVVFLIESTFRILFYISAGIITLDASKQALLLFPVMLLGLGLGIYSSNYLNEKLIKLLVIFLLILSGFLLI